MPKYRYIGVCASEARVGENCVPLAPGDFVTLSSKDMEHQDNAALTEKLIVADAKGGDDK